MDEMLAYIGTKLINAKPMNRLDYNVFRGWDLPSDENGTDEGYLIEYVDSTTSNTETYEGYVSWTPKVEFEDAYMSVDGMSFGLATSAAERGFRVARASWNGKGMYIYYVPATVINHYGMPLKVQAYFMMKTAQDTLVPWFASQSDMLDTDWSIIED